MVQATSEASTTAASKRKQKKENIPITIYNLKKITPLTDNQKLTFESWDKKKNLVLSGFPGVGKTFLALYLGLKWTLDPSTVYDKVVIYRSLVETRKAGFLPGTIEEKQEQYEKPYKQICQQLIEFNEITEVKSDIYAKLKMQGKVEFESTTYVRGTSVDNSIILVDEMQNLSLHELYSVFTRMGKNTKIIFSGDYEQSDLRFEDERVGIVDFLEILNFMMPDDFTRIDFQAEDCVRSGIVKRFLFAMAKWKQSKA